MVNALPLLLVGGAILLMSGKKRKRTVKKDADDKPIPLPIPKSDTRPRGMPLPDVEDLDEQDRDEPPHVDPIPDDLPPDTEEDSEEEPLVSSEPELGPSGTGSCANPIYSRDPQYLTPDITVANEALTIFTEDGYYFYIRSDFQKKLYNYMLQRFSAMKNGQERRTVASVVLRESLKHFNSGCKWEYAIDSLSDAEKLVWDGGSRLAIMAQITTNLVDPGPENLFQTGNRYSITRDSLGDVDPGFMGAQKKPTPGTRVEILVTDESQENAEHIIGEIVKMSGPNDELNLFEIRIVDKFQGNDVSPRLRTKHGFKVGSNAYFSQKGPTGIYRIFPEGMV